MIKVEYLIDRRVFVVVFPEGTTMIIPEYIAFNLMR